MNVPAEDRALSARLARNDSGALEEFISLHGGSLYGFLRSALGQRAAFAYSFLAAAFAQTVRSTSSDLKEPLRVILTRSLLSRIQKNLKPKHAEGPLPGAERRISVLFLSLACLPWEERILLLLRDQADYSMEELQAVFSKTESEIRGRLQKARLHFREALKKTLKDKSVLNS